MPKFAAKCMAFLLIGGMLIFPICVLSHNTYQQSLNDRLFYLSKNTSIIVAGDSHTQVSVNPMFLPHSESIACSAENYFFTYHKLRHFLSQNPQISTVILGFSWHNFPQSYQDSFLFGNSRSNVEDYYLLLDSEGKSVVKSWSSSYLVPWLRYTAGLPIKIYLDKVLLCKLRGMNLTREKTSFGGGFKYTTKSVINKKMTDEKLRAYYRNELDTVSNSSIIMVEYLEKILKMCSDLNIRVILFNTPVHDSYRSGVPVQAISSFEAIRSSILTRYQNLLYVDYSTYRLPAEFFYDGDHLNAFGAEIVTKLLRRVIDHR